MPSASFIQNDFRGGIWSPTAQGRSTVEAYKTALNVSTNALALEQAAWTRRPGFRYIGYTYKGLPAVLRAFRFSRAMAFQAEFTAGHLRFVAGLTHLLEAAQVPTVVGISDDTPALVSVSDITGWANGDIVMFTENSAPPSSYYLAGRQFEIAAVDNTANTFTLKDPFTGVAIDGSLIAWTLQSPLATVQRVLTYATPYAEADLGNTRVCTALGKIANEDFTIVLNKAEGSVGFKPYALKQNGDTQFTFAVADFIDGPYFDLNETVTTLGLSGITGSVTVTASSVVGINEGDGFKSTDVGRHIWWQGGPAAWDIAIPYGKQERVLGSDNNIYQSLIKNNLAFDPTDDDGSRWEITQQQLRITWLKITAFTSTTIVTATIMNDNLESTIGSPGDSTNAPTTQWRLGLYSDTTGYPSCAAYHSGRLYLAGAQSNRGDGSMIFQPLTFSPTYEDGTIADDNGVTFILANKDAEAINWMQSTTKGMIAGTLSGNWLIHASEQNDPITPSSIQGDPLTSDGSANIEPVYLYGAPYFVQAASKKLLSTLPTRSGEFETINHSEMSDSIMNPGVDEIAWVQEPLLTMFCRRTNGTLIGYTHRLSERQESFGGWTEHAHGYGRAIEAISGGPDFSGTSDSLFAVTAAGSVPASSPRWVETIMPQPSAGAQTWRYWHVDSSSVGWFIRRMIVANGDSFDGLRVFGLHHLAGLTIHPYIGGLDLGDFVVSATGTVDLPYAGSFTAAFLAGISDTTVDSEWGMFLRWYDGAITDEPVHPKNSILVIDNTGGTVSPTGDFLMMDMQNDVAYRLGRGATSDLDTIRVFDALTGEMLRETIAADVIFGAVGTDKALKVDSFFHEGGAILWAFARADLNSLDGFLVGYSWSSLQDCTLAIIDATTLIQVAETPFADLLKNVFTFSYHTSLGDIAQLAFVAKQLDANTFNKISIVNLTLSGPLRGGGVPWGQGDVVYSENMTESEQLVFGCRGWEAPGLSTFYTYGGNGNATTWTDATLIRIREWTLEGQAAETVVHNRIIRDLLVTEVDATWTQISDVAINYCASDGTLLLWVHKYVSGPGRLLKLDAVSGTIIYNTEIQDAAVADHFPSQDQGPWTRDRWSYMDVNSVVHDVDLTDGSVSLPSGVQTGFFSIDDTQWYDEIGPSIILNGEYTENAGQTAFYLGDWAIAEEPSWTPDQWNRIWLGTDWEQSQFNRDIDATYQFVPAQFGISFTSRGQLLRPDYGADAGARNGPAVGKTRRAHQFALDLYRAFNVSVGTDFDKLKPVKLQTPGGTNYVAPALFTGMRSDTLSDDYSYESKLAWEVTRQYPCTIKAAGGFIATQDR